MFVALGDDAREVLDIVVFFPQGVEEGKLEWVLPTVACIQDIMDTSRIFSLTRRTGSFVTMLAPLRDVLLPKDLLSAPLLLTPKAQYSARLALIPNTHVCCDLGFSETQSVVSDDTSVEPLLNDFTSLDTESEDVLRAGSRPILQFIRPRRPFIVRECGSDHSRIHIPGRLFASPHSRRVLLEVEDGLA